MALRCFIAIELPEALKQEIASRTESLRASKVDAKWVAPENLHLTLKFLGSTPEERIGAIGKALEDALSGLGTFGFSLRGVGAFPSLRRPRVIWVGVEDHDALADTNKRVENAMQGLGYEPEDRPYSAHLTLGRLRSQRRARSLLDAIEPLEAESFGQVEVSEISLMKSDLKPTGPVYSRIVSVPFGLH